MDNKKNIKQTVLCAIFLLIGVLGGCSLSFLINTKTVRTSLVSKKTSSKFDSLYETYEIIKDKYYDKVDDETLINGAIDGMMKSLGDEHSNFLDKDSKESFEDELGGSYYGIGAEITQVDEDVMITKVFDDSPAKKSGLKPGDIFVSIDGKSVKGKSPTEIASNLKSKKKDKAEIIVKRDGEEVKVEITKDIVNLLSVDSEMFDDNIGYVGISVFGENTYSQFTNALSKLEEKGMKSLIIDLRGNGGGYLYTVTNMISEFVDSKTVIYQMKTKDGITKYKAENDKTKDYKVVILIDGNSASASEIMASAMQEQYHATLVGTKTYGKGTVQEMQDLPNGTLIKYTIQEWLTSKGNSINEVGIKPDVEVKLGEEYAKNPTKENDSQLQKAIELLK